MNNTEPLSEKQKATNWETLKHIELVMQLLETVKHEISRRMFSHDRSKLESPELQMFEQFTNELAGLTYGSDEYKRCLEQMKKLALGHHYKNNRHHPEYFEDCAKDTSAIERCENVLAGLKQIQVSYPKDEYVFGYAIDIIEAHKQALESNINGMNLVDIVEMICDWLAACKRHNDGNIYRSVEINKDRFGISPQLVSIILNTLPLLNSIYSARTQKHLNEYWHCCACGSGGLEGNFCSMCGAGKSDFDPRP
jgi:hypothetical protein